MNNSIYAGNGGDSSSKLVVPIVVPICVALAIFFIGYYCFIHRRKKIGSTLQEGTGNMKLCNGSQSILAKLYV